MKPIRKIARPRRPKDAGFSLVELMVVIFIMGLLATLVIINVAPVGEQSRVGKVRADIAAFESALEMYSLDMYSYPNAEAAISTTRPSPTCTPVPKVAGPAICPASRPASIPCASTS